MDIKGIYNTAKVFTNNIEEDAVIQIQNMMNDKVSQNANIRIMPDVHLGKDCVIGFTSSYTGKINPSYVGADVACGVYAYELPYNISIKKLDENVKKIPAGFHNVHETPIKLDESFFKNFLDNLKDLCKRLNADEDYIMRSLGTLGSGNHFLEVDVDERGVQWVVVHSGSRNLGAKIYEYYDNLIKDKTCIINSISSYKKEGLDLIRNYFNGKDIKTSIRYLEVALNQIKELYNSSYLTGNDAAQYLADSSIAYIFADISRTWMLKTLIGEEYLNPFNFVTSVHNYIDGNYIRKGAIDASLGKKIIIPLNMRDGSLICVGKGNKDWNYSAPHGAGRIMSRTEARKTLNIKDFEASMKGIHSTCINEYTIDESPKVYKKAKEIEKLIAPTAEVIHHLKPIWNFKGV